MELKLDIPELVDIEHMNGFTGWTGKIFVISPKNYADGETLIACKMYAHEVPVWDDENSDMEEPADRYKSVIDFGKPIKFVFDGQMFPCKISEEEVLEIVGKDTLKKYKNQMDAISTLLTKEI